MHYIPKNAVIEHPGSWSSPDIKFNCLNFPFPSGRTHPRELISCMHQKSSMPPPPRRSHSALGSWSINNPSLHHNSLLHTTHRLRQPKISTPTIHTPQAFLPGSAEIIRIIISPLLAILMHNTQPVWASTHTHPGRSPPGRSVALSRAHQTRHRRRRWLLFLISFLHNFHPMHRLQRKARRRKKLEPRSLNPELPPVRNYWGKTRVFGTRALNSSSAHHTMQFHMNPNTHRIYFIEQ